MPTVPQAGLWMQFLNNCLWKEWFPDSAVPWIPDTTGTAEDLRDHRIQCQRSGWRDAPPPHLAGHVSTTKAPVGRR